LEENEVLVLNCSYALLQSHSKFLNLLTNDNLLCPYIYIKKSIKKLLKGNLVTKIALDTYIRHHIFNLKTYNKKVFMEVPDETDVQQANEDKSFY